MKIQSIKIKNLFEMFDYDISINEEENVLLITGANGFGKTMILNIIFNLFNQRFAFFETLVFDEIDIILENEILIRINKKNKKTLPIFIFYKNTKKVAEIDFSSNQFVLQNNYEINKYLTRTSRDLVSDIKNHNLSKRDIILREIISTHSNDLFIDTKELKNILNSIQIHIIKEQRLFKEIKEARDIYNFFNDDRDGDDDDNFTPDKKHSVMSDTITMHAKELKQIISQNINESFKKTQVLDSTYLSRLIIEKKVISEDEYNSRLLSLNEKQEKLIEFGLYQSKQEITNYSKDDAKALLIYINDLEQKLSVFDDLLQKLELFTTILNERRFTFKSINIDREKGFFFKTSKGKELALDQLSSGEQHEVVLLYELIFNVKSNVLVLIDEPEISLHITWQKEFLNDLLKIAQMQNIQVIVATHAPAIINGRWDLVYTLQAPENI
ncbi:MAG: hypothetical protein EAZ06_02940 [Cytophagales bacterium]|nr:MAG: hypothetical protein EAZ06_02940 [Cytophagales bacterium]